MVTPLSHLCANCFIHVRCRIPLVFSCLASRVWFARQCSWFSILSVSLAVSLFTATQDELALDPGTIDPVVFHDSFIFFKLTS